MTVPGRTQRPQTAEGDFFSTLVPWALIALMILPFLALFLWLVPMSLGVEYGTPPWNTHSVPPPWLY